MLNVDLVTVHWNFKDVSTSKGGHRLKKNKQNHPRDSKNFRSDQTLTGSRTPKCLKDHTKITKVGDGRIILMVKQKKGRKKPFQHQPRSRTLKVVGASKSTIKTCLHEHKYRGFIARCKSLFTVKNKKT